MAKVKTNATNVLKLKTKKNNKGVHSKNNPPEKKYRGQGKKR
jgi:hypothetical protein